MTGHAPVEPVPAKPSLWAYAENLARRMSGDPNTLHSFSHGDPCALVVGILGYAAEDDRLDEHDRARCAAWLSRLVWPGGEPKDDVPNAWEAFIEGFKVSGKRFNGEDPFRDHAEDPTFSVTLMASFSEWLHPAPGTGASNPETGLGVRPMPTVKGYCGRCKVTELSVERWKAIVSPRGTAHYESFRRDGKTWCGIDATGPEWWWPL